MFGKNAPKHPIADVEANTLHHADTEQEIDSELIAVITAAIVASLGTESRIVVRSIRRINDITPTWGKAGRNDVMANRF